jgi:RNA polymerase sigma-70 factor (ECF subfamily)
MTDKMKSLSEKVTFRSIAKKSPLSKNFFKRKTDLRWKLSQTTSELENIVDGSLPYRRSSDLERMQELSDSEVIVIIIAQNRGAYKELFSRYQKKLFTYIYHLVGNREETEDILQNVFSKTYRNISHFDTSRKFSSWIYRIAHNEAVNFLKRKSKRYTVSWEDILTSKDKLDSASGEELPEEKMEHQEIAKRIDDAIEKIPAKYQQVLKMRYFQEYSYEEISRKLGKPLNTVGTLINRAKHKLLEAIKEK